MLQVLLERQTLLVQRAWLCHWSFLWKFHEIPLLPFPTSQHIQQLVQHIQHNRAEGKFLHNTQHAQRPTLPPRFCFQRFAAVRFAYPTLKSGVWPYPIKLGIWPYIEKTSPTERASSSADDRLWVGGWVRERFGGGCPLLNQNGREGTHDHPPTQAHYTCYYSHCMFIPTLNMHSVPPPSEILFSKICCCQICSPNTLVGCLALPNQVGYLTLILKTSPTEWEVFFSKWLAFGPFHLHLLFWRRRRIWGGVISCTWVASRAYLAALWPARSQPQSVFHPAGGFEKIQATYYARQTECCECPTPESVYLQDQLRLTDPQICVPRPHVCENLGHVPSVRQSFLQVDCALRWDCWFQVWTSPYVVRLRTQQA